MKRSGPAASQRAPVAIVVLSDKWEEVEFVIRKHPAVKQPASGHTSCSASDLALRLKAAFVHTQTPSAGVIHSKCEYDYYYH